MGISLRQLSTNGVLSLLQLFRLLWLYSALYDLSGIGSRGPKYPFPEAWRLGLGQIALASPFAVVGGGSETTGEGCCFMCQPAYSSMAMVKQAQDQWFWNQEHSRPGWLFWHTCMHAKRIT